MRKFLIASHGKLASGMKSSLDILLGNSDNVTVIDAYLDNSRVEDKVDAFYETVGEDDQAILLSDLYGGSVNQVLFRYLSKPNTFLVAGVNLALVLELVACNDPLTQESLNEVIETSRIMLKQVIDDNKPVEQSEDDFF